MLSLILLVLGMSGVVLAISSQGRDGSKDQRWSAPVSPQSYKLYNITMLQRRVVWRGDERSAESLVPRWKVTH